MLVLLRAGMLPIITVADPGAHGAGITGTQGIGVKTPKAAAVAEATSGFAMELHIPKGGMFTIGMLSMMFEAGVPPTMTLFFGSTLFALGATPKVQAIMAPMTTC